MSIMESQIGCQLTEAFGETDLRDAFNMNIDE